jgi:PST family polysaccharide transporter
LGESPLDSIRVLGKLLKYLTPILLLLVAFVLVYANRLTLLLTGGVNLSTVLNMRILSGILLVGTYNNILGVLGMVNLGMEAHFRNSVLVCGLFNVVAAMIGSHFLLDVGASLSILLTEILLASMLMFHLYRKSRNV